MINPLQVDFLKKRLEEITGMKIKKVVMREETKSMELFFK